MNSPSEKNSLDLETPYSSNLTTAQDFKQNLETIVTQQIKKQFNTEFNEKISHSLEDFQSSLIQKVKQKTLEKIQSEIFSQEDSIAQTISQDIIKHYRQEILDALIARKKPFLPQLPPSIKQQIEETNVYLGYQPTLESMQIEESTQFEDIVEDKDGILNIPSSNSNIYSDYPSSNSLKQEITSEFSVRLSLFSLFGLMISIALLYFSSSLIFLREFSVLLSMPVAFISMVFVSSLELKYFKQRGLNLSLINNGLSFRWGFLFVKLICISCIFGLIFLTDIRFHTMDFQYSPTKINFWWIATTNKFFGFLQTWISLSVMSIIQTIILGLAVLLSFFKLSKIFIKP